MSSIQELVDISKKYKNRYIKNKEIEKEFEFIVNILKIDGINLIDALVYSIIYDIHNNYLNITDTIENEEYTDIDRLAWGKDSEYWHSKNRMNTSNSSMAKKLNVDKKQIANSVNKLKRLKLIYSKNKGKDRELWINIFFRSDDIQFISITGELELN